MDRRLFLAVVLSSAVLFTYPLVLSRLYPPPTPSTPRSAQQGPEAATAPAVPIIQAPPEPTSQPAYHQVTGQDLSLLYSDRSGGIQRLILPPYEDLRSRQAVILLATEDPREQLFSLVVEDRDGVTQPLISSYHAEYTYDTTKFTATLANNLRVMKSFSVSADSPVITCEIRLSNPTDRPLDFSAHTVLSLQPVNGMTKTSYTAPTEAVIVTPERLIKVAQPSVIKHAKHQAEHPLQVALVGRHFCLISTVPPGVSGVTVAATRDGHGIQTRLPIHRSIAPGATEEFHWSLYAGPSDYRHVKAIGQGFERSLRLGFLGHIGLLLLAILTAINAVVHNYGVAIILLTVLVSVLLVPFNLMSLKSMQRMKALQPLAEALRVKHKDNKEKFNKEYMELMKKHRVNPMAGCLVPLLVQMPIFFALLRVLSNSIELRGAGFLWIKDLSAPDHLARLPTALPFFGDELNLLPLLTIGAMFLQQKISQASMGQANPEGMPDMSLIMLIMFGVWMYHTPSGPVLYWLVNTIIMIIWFRIANLRPVVLEP